MCLSTEEGRTGIPLVTLAAAWADRRLTANTFVLVATREAFPDICYVHAIGRWLYRHHYHHRPLCTDLPQHCPPSLPP